MKINDFLKQQKVSDSVLSAYSFFIQNRDFYTLSALKEKLISILHFDEYRDLETSLRLALLARKNKNTLGNFLRNLACILNVNLK